MNRYVGTRDVSFASRTAQPSPPMLLMYLCGTARDPHKGPRAGGKVRGGLLLQCPACVAKESAK